jgi:hypothetical protein
MAEASFSEAGKHMAFFPLQPSGQISFVVLNLSFQLVERICNTGFHRSAGRTSSRSASERCSFLTRAPSGDVLVNERYRDLYEAAGAADATACSRIGSW